MADEDAPDGAAHEVEVRIECGRDFESLRPKATVLGDSLAEPAHAHQAHPPLPVDAEDLAQLGQQTVDIVAPALLAKAPEVAQVLADLGRGHVEQLSERLRTDHSIPIRRQFGECPRIRGEAVDYNFWYLKGHGRAGMVVKFVTCRTIVRPHPAGQ